MNTLLIPELDYLYSSRVVVCTLATAGIFARVHENPRYKTGHFSYVIIDESACTHETMSMVAIAGGLHSIISSPCNCMDCICMD